MSTLLRLRPVVHATPTATGLHVRGWTSSFTVDGGSGLWKVWQWLAVRLADGLPPEQLTPPPGVSAGVAAAFEALIGQLHEHDMLVQVPATWPGGTGPAPQIAGWLESVAADPAAAWERLRAARATVIGSGPAASAARRALADGGLPVASVPGDDLLILVGHRHLTAEQTPPADGYIAVAGRCGPDAGYVVATGTPAEVLADTEAVADRLAIPADSPNVSPVLAALIGGAAAHRILCALAGLPDPAEEAATLSGEPTASAIGEDPAVLVARLDPLRAAYHPWLSRRSGTSVLDGLAAALHRLDAVCDPELGPLPAPNCGPLPQTPAALALAGEFIGVGTTADAARVDAALRVAQSRLAADVAVGVNARHARGIALRRGAHAHLADLATEAVPESEWSGDPTARRWWKALTLRFAVPAAVRAERLAEGIVHAEIRAAGTVLAWAVEASAADAVAMAALAATGVCQAQAAGASVATGSVTLTGAAPTWLPDNLAGSAWTGREWYWPADVADAEEHLQATLGALGPAPQTTVEEALAELLSAAGFAVVTVPSWATVGDRR